MRKNFKQYKQPEVEKRDFNDVLDFFSNQFTPVEKSLGLATLPFQPFLHPLKTVKGVFETYNKLATIPLAAYSGNADKIPGIISGDEEFSGKDVIQQMQGGVEQKGILPAIEGFAIDVATDPFIGAVRLPKEIAEFGNKFVMHSAAPGLPTVLKDLGARSWIARGTSTGLGRDSKSVTIQKAFDAPVGEKSATYAKLQEDEAIKKAAEEELKKLNGELDEAKQIKIPLDTDDEGNFIYDVKKYIDGEKRMNPEEYTDAQAFADHAELERISNLQYEHQGIQMALDHTMKLLTENDPEAIIKQKQEVTKAIEKYKLENPNATQKDFNSFRYRFVQDYVKEKGKVNFNIHDLFNLHSAFIDNPANIATKKKLILDEIARFKKRNPKVTRAEFIEFRNNTIQKVMSDNITPPELTRYVKNLNQSAVDMTGTNRKYKKFKKFGNVRTQYVKGKYGGHYIFFGDRKSIQLPDGTIVKESTYLKGKRKGKFGGIGDHVGKGQDNIIMHKLYNDNFIGDHTILDEHKTITSNSIKSIIDTINHGTPNPEFPGLKKHMSYQEFIDWADNTHNQDLIEWVHGVYVPSVERSLRTSLEEIVTGDDNYIDELYEDYLTDLADSNAGSVFDPAPQGGKDYSILMNKHRPVVLKDSITEHLESQGLIQYTGKEGQFKIVKDFVMPKYLNDKAKLYMTFDPQQTHNIFHNLLNSNYEMLHTFGPEGSEAAYNLERAFTAYKNGQYNLFLKHEYAFINHITERMASLMKDYKATGIKKPGFSFYQQLEEVIQPLELMNKDPNTFMITQMYNTIIPNMAVEGGVDSVDPFIKEAFKYETFKKGKFIYDHQNFDRYINVDEFKTAAEYEAELEWRYAEAAELETSIVKEKYKAKKKFNDPLDADIKNKDMLNRLKYGAEVKEESNFARPLMPEEYEALQNKIEELEAKKALVTDEFNTELIQAHNNYIQREVAKIKEQAGVNAYVRKVEKLTAKMNVLQNKIKEYTYSTTELQSLNNKITAEVDEFEKNTLVSLGAEQLERYVNIRRNTAQPFTNSMSKLDEAHEAIQRYVFKNFSGTKAQVKRADQMIHKALESVYKDSKVKIGGKNLVKDLILRNFTLGGKFSTNEVASLERLAEQLNTSIGREGLFKVRSCKKPNHTIKVFSLDKKLIYDAEKGLKDRELVKQITAWLKSNIGKEFEVLEFDSSLKTKITTKFNEQEQMLIDSLTEARLHANNEFKKYAEYAGLGDQFTNPEGYFPHAVNSTVQGTYDAILLDGPLVDDHNIQLASKIKNELGLTGSLGASTSAKSIVGNPVDFKVWHKMISKAGSESYVEKRLFSRNFSKAYRKAFSSAFAEHERIRVSYEIMTHNDYKLANLKIAELPHEAIASTDILIPVYDGKRLVKYRKYAPTPANVEKYKNSGYLVDKSISAEVRTMLNYETTIGRSPALQWFTKNINSAFKKGVLLNFGFPLGNAGDMWFKTLADKPFAKWGLQQKNTASAYSTLMAHETHMRAYATVKQSVRSLRDVSFYQYLNDMHEFFSSGRRAAWMKQKEAAEHLAHRAKQIKAGTPVVQDLVKAISYEMYTTLPTATTNYQETFLTANEILRKTKDQDYANWLKTVYRSPIGNALHYVSAENWVADNFHKVNEKLENGFRFTDLMTEAGLTTGKDLPVLDKNRKWMINEMIKYNHMQFAEMPGDAAWLSLVMPFWQFPLKNAAWWANFISKKPEFAAQIFRVKKSFWDDEADSFWARLGSLPITDNLVMRGIPGLGSYSSFALGLDDTTNMVGQRLSPVIRPFVTTDGDKYKPYSMSDRTPHSDNRLKAWLHGMNPVEGNIQYGLNLIGGQEPLPARVLPSAVRGRD